MSYEPIDDRLKERIVLIDRVRTLEWDVSTLRQQVTMLAVLCDQMVEALESLTLWRGEQTFGRSGTVDAPDASATGTFRATRSEDTY